MVRTKREKVYRKVYKVKRKPSQHVHYVIAGHYRSANGTPFEYTTAFRRRTDSGKLVYAYWEEGRFLLTQHESALHIHLSLFRALVSSGTCTYVVEGKIGIKAC